MISVITAVYNRADSIADCMASFASQTYPDKEQLVIDGASTDNTVEVVKQHLSPQVRLNSEPDSGIYDALNKGVRLAKSDIIGFLHSDDMFGGPDVLARVAAEFDKDPELEGVYGDLVYVAADDPSKTIRYWKSGHYAPGHFLLGWMPPHPTLFLRKSVYERVGEFRTDFDIAADYEFTLRALHVHRMRVKYIPEVFTRMRLGGMSNRSLGNLVRKTRQDLKAWQLNGMGHLGPSAVLLKNVTKLPQFFVRPES